jgi:hypothetical protein
MQAPAIGRTAASSRARLQLLLIALALWDITGFLVELTDGWFIDQSAIDGLLGARAVSGAALVLGIGYLYAARNPVRYRFMLWLAALEQLVALFTAAFHMAVGNLDFSECALSIIVAGAFLILLIANRPRQTDTIGA